MLQGNKIDCEDEVKPLGVTFDFKLTFNSHVSHICKKASQQLNVLKRRSPFFTKSKISFIKILNITGPRMDPWGTPLYISRKELQTDSILTHCFL
jgi:hypothetical protein